MATELRQKKLASGKEKLAAFRSKKAKALKKLNANSNASFEIDEELRQQVLQDFNSTAKGSEETSPSDSELCSLTSDDEQFDEAAILCSSQTHVPFTLSELENAMDEKHMIKDIIQYGEPSQWTDLSRIESALSQRDELLSQLASSLEFFQKHPSQTDDFTTQLCALAQHICTLKAKLNQANEDLQEQLILHESSMISLQAAKAQILQLQMIIIKKDEHINSLSQKVQMENEALKLKDKTIEHCQLNLLAQSAELDTIRREMESKLVEIQQWAEANKEWELKEQELLASVCDKSEEIFSLEKSLQVLKQENSELHEKYVSLQASSAENNSDARLHDLEQHLAGLRSAHELDLQEMSRLQKRNHDLEISCHDHLKSLSLYQSLQQDYDHIMAQHSSCLQQLENLNILNANLQHKIDLLGQAEQEHQVLRQHFGELKFSYDCEVRKRSELEAKLLDFENSLESKTNGRTPPFQTTSVLYHTATNNESEYQVKEMIEAGLHTAGNFERNVSSGERNGSFQQDRIEIVPAEIDSPCQELDSEKLQLLAVNEDLRFKLNSSEALNRQYVERLGLLENVTYPDQNIYSPHMGVIGSNTEELEQLKEEIKKLTLKIQTQEIELNKTTTELTVSKESLMRIESELTLVNQFNSQESSTGENTVQEIEDIYRLQLVQQQLREKETTQEELQSQLESTITQWQKLQLIVQEKEIDIQNLHENLDEQKRICGNMTKSHQDYVEALQSEIETLRLRLEEYQEKFFSMENEILLLITEKNSIQNEDRKGNELSHKEMLCTEILTDLNSVDAETQTSCLDPESQDIPIEPELHTALRDAEFQTASLYAEMDENINQQIKAEKLSEVSSIHLKDTYQSAQLTLSEDCVTVLELKQSIIQKDSLISSLQRTVADFQKMETRIHNFESELVTSHDNLKERLKLSEDNLAMKEAENVNMSKKLTAHQLKLKAFKKQISQKDKVIAELTDKITESQNQISDINPQVTEKNNEISELLNQIVQKDEIIADMQLRLSKRDQSFESRNKIKNKELEVQTDSNVDRDVLSDLTETLFERNTEVTGLNRVVIEREELLSRLNKELCDINERYTDLLKNASEKDNELDEKEDQLSAATTQLAEKDEQLSAATRQLAEKDEQLSAATTQLAEKDEQLSAATTQLAEKDEQLSAATTQLAEKDEQLSAATRQLAEKEDQLSAATRQLAEKDEQLSVASRQLAEKDEQLSAATRQLAEKDEQLSVASRQLAEKDEQLSVESRQLAEKEDQLSAATRQLAEKEDQLSAATRQLAEKDEQLSVASRQLAEKDEQLSVASRQLAEKEDQLSAATRQLAEKEDHLSAATTQLAEKDEQHSAATTQLAEKDEQLSAATTQLAEKDEQLSAATTQLAEKDEQLSAATRQLAEKDEQLSVASRQLAEKDEQLSVESRQLAEKEDQLSAATRQLAEKDEQHSAATTQLAEKDEQLSAATTQLAEKDEQLSAATTQLAEKDEQLSAATTQLAEKDEQLSAATTQLADKEDQLSAATTQLAEKDEQLSAATMQFADKEDQFSAATRQLAEKDEQLSAATRQLAEKEDQLSAATTQLAEKDEQLSAGTTQLAEKDEQLSAATMQLAEKDERLGAATTQLAEKDEQLSAATTQLAEKNEQLSAATRQLAEKDKQLSAATRQFADKEDQLSAATRQLAEKDEQLSAATRQLADKEDQLSAATTQLAEKDEQLSAATRQLDEKETFISTLNIRFLEMTEKESYIVTRQNDASQEILHLQETITHKDEELAVFHQKLQGISEDITQLKSVVSERDRENFSLAEGLLARDSEVLRLTDHFKEKDDELSSIRKILTDKEEEIVQLHKQLSETKNQEASIALNLSSQNEEVNRLLGIINQRDEQLENLRKELSEKSDYVSELVRTGVERDETITSKEKEHSHLLAISDKKDAMIAALNKTMAEKGNELTELSDQISSHLSAAQDKAAELTYINEQLFEKDETIGNLLISVSGKNDLIIELNGKLTQMTEDFAQLQKAVSEGAENSAALTSSLCEKDNEISKLNITVTEQLEDISNLKEKLIDRDIQYQSVLSEKNELEITLDHNPSAKFKETNELHKDISEKDQQLIDLKKILTEQSAEILHLQEIISEKESVVDKQSSEKDALILSLQYQITDKEVEISHLQTTLVEKDTHFNDIISAKEADISTLSRKLTLQCSELNRALLQKDEEMGDLLITLSGQQETVSLLNCNLVSSSQEISSLHSVISERDIHIKDLSQRLSDQAQEMNNLKENISALIQKLTVKDGDITAQQEKVSEKDQQIVDLSGQLAKVEIDKLQLQKEVVERQGEVCKTQAITGQIHDEIEVLRKSDLMAARDVETTTLLGTVLEKEDALLSMMTILNEREHSIAQIQNVLSEKTLEMDSLQKILEDKNSELVASQIDIECRNEENAKLLLIVKVKEESISALQSQLNMVSDVKNETNLLLSAKENEIVRLTDQINDLVENNSKLSEKLSLMESVTVCQKDEQLNEMSKQLSEKGEELAAINHLITLKDKDIGSLNETVLNKSEEVRQLSAMLELKIEEVVKLTAITQHHTENCHGQLVSVQQQLADKDSVIESITLQLSEVDRLWKDTAEKLTNRDSELETLNKAFLSKESDIDAAHLKFVDLDNTNRELNDTIVILNQKLADCMLKLNTKETDLSETLLRLSEKEEIISGIQSERDNIVEQIVQQDICINGLKDTVTSHESEISRQKQQYHDVVSMMKVEQAGLLAEVDNLTRALGKKDLEHDQVELDSSHMKSQLLDLESEIERIKKEFEYSDSEKKVLEASNNDLLSVKESLLLRLDDMEQKMKEKDTEISEMSERLVQEKEHCKLLVNSNTKLQKSYTHLQSCLSYLMATSEESQSMLIQQKISLQEQEVNLSTHSSSQNVPHTSQDVPDGNRSHEDVGESHSKLVTEKSLNYQLLLNHLLVLTEDCQNKDGLLLEQNLEMDRNSSLIADLSAKLEETNLTLSEAVQSNTSLRAEADALKVQCHTLTDGESVLNQRISLLEAEVESQGLISSHHVTECNTLADNMAQLSQELNVKEKLLLAAKLEAESYLKEVNDLKAGLELKAATERSLKESVDSLTSLLEKSQEERELLKANFDSCMEDMQQKHAQQELDIQNLKSQLAEQTKTVYQGQDQLKDLFELQICQLEEKLLLSEKHGEHLAKELADSKAKYSSCKDLFEGQMSDLEISLQAANSETAKLRDQLSKVTHNHECDFAGLKRLHEIQTSELEESCLSLERNVSELKRQITEQAAKFKKEKSGLEQSLDFHLSDFEEKRRLHETEISRLKRHLEEMKQDHEMELRNLEKSYEARMYELEDKCCITTNELERLRKFFSSDGEYSEERHRLDLRIDELETKRRDLEIQNMALEDEVKHLREQEEEFKSLLHSMAEKRDEKSTEKAEEVIFLKHELSEMAHEKNQVDLSLQTKKADLERVMNRNKELESRIAYLEVLVEHTVTLGMKDKDGGERSSLSNMSDLQRKIDSLSEENRSLKRQLVLQEVPKRSLRLNSGVEAICPPYSHTSTEYTSSQTINNECFSPVLDDEVLEGFVAEKCNSNRQKSECNMNNNSRVNPEPDFVVEQNDSFQEPDFVVEQTDRFQPEIDNERLMDGGSQLDMHPIWENEGFQPEKSDLFLMETIEEPEQRMDWPNELSVCLSPSQHQISEHRFDFSNSGEHCHSSHVQETEEKNLGGEEGTVLVNNKTCEDGENTRQINQLKEDLEEQYVMKMRKQESDLMFKYESQCDQYKKEMEQHFAQRVQAVRYEWERKFTKALRKLKKDMEKRGLPEQAQDHRSRTSDSTDSYCGRMNSVSAADIAGRHEELGEVVEKLHKENQELAEVRDDLLRQIEISRARGLHDRVQHELQTMLTTRDSHSLPCAPVQTILPPAVDYEESVTPANLSIDEGDGSKSEASDSSSVRECFLEELEESSHQSGQDLPLEWELTSTESGAFEQEPASIWEVFDGRCVRQDCQEVRIRFHKLYKWVVKHQGVGCDSLLYELNYLLGNTLDTEALKNESIDYSLNKTAHQSPNIAASDAASESIGSYVCNASGDLNQNSTNSSEVSIPIARKSIYEEIMELNMTELGQNSESHIDEHEIAVHEGCGPNVESDSSKSSVHRDSELLVMSFSENSDKNVDDSPITLQDQKLADELNLLRKDLVDTKAIYCKEHALLQKALLKNQEGKVKVKSQRTSDKNFELCGHQTGKLTPDSSGEHEITKQKLAICMEQIAMLEDENTSLRSRLRKQEAMTIHLKFQLHQKDQDVIEWQNSFSNHLTALQKQRSDLLQLLEDKESGKEPFISGGLQEVQMSDTVQQVQDDLLGKIEELDHLYKMLTLRQIELQHCEAERRHLEQMCLLKDFTEIQLKKQKRLMEEHISEIELRLHDREAALREDKNRLLQELKEQDIKLSDTTCVRVPADSQPSPNFTEEKSSNLSSPKQARNDENDTSRQHIKAIEVLRAKLLKEYEMQAAKLEKVKRENMKS
ncbi:hypothetical protein Btru_004502 [Bulinus truncatus]|nr:hypothetical protein Btru_004502 [Bulinus truncatus]